MPDPASKAVFLSYASQDAEAARRICAALRAAGIEVWFDQSELRGGDAWDQKIKKQIRECALFVPVVSANTNARAEGYFRLEWKLAVERSRLMADDAAFIVPAVIDEMADADARVPDKFREVQWTRLTGAAAPAEFSDRVRVLLDGSATPVRLPRVGGAAGASSKAVEPMAGRRRLRWWWMAVTALLALVALSTWAWRRAAKINWAMNSALPEISRLADEEQFTKAFALVRSAERYLPNDRRLQDLAAGVSRPLSIESDPAGAEVRMMAYGAADSEWEVLGITPLKQVRVPRGVSRVQVRLDGYETVERLVLAGQAAEFLKLDRRGSIPAGMVRVPSAREGRLALTGLDHFQAPGLEEFFLDRYEVSNREFEEFMTAGGYRKREYWKHPIVKQGRELNWEEAMREFRDTTGQPGPATWEAGRYPQGRADHPVSGVSWFEACAYAEYAGKALPTVYHWSRTALMGIGNPASVIRQANFAGPTPLARQQSRGITGFGTQDLAGNVKEWCWNAADTREERRYVLGGAALEPPYMFNDPDAQSPLNRLPGYGFRCVKYVTAPPAELLGPLVMPSRDYQRETPATDEAFAIYRSFYAYDKTPLNAKVEATDQTSEHWRREKVTFDAAYNRERMSAYVFVPRNVSPPYQSVVFFPGSGSLRTRAFPEADLAPSFDYVVRSGRLVIWPIYKSTYERGDGLLTDRPNLTSNYRDHVIYWYKDFARSLDYLETRQDVDRQKIAYYGTSWGAATGVILLGLEQRCRAAVLVIGGFWQQRGPPEVEHLNFAPRINIPVLMLNGRYDFPFPVKTAQEPMFRWLGTAEPDKRHILFESGHSVPRKELMTESLQWLDRYLGPAR
jgi:dienelactone hydrolase